MPSSSSSNREEAIELDALSRIPPSPPLRATKPSGVELPPRFDPYASQVVDPNLALLSPEDPDDEDPTANCPRCKWQSIKRYTQGRGTRCFLYCSHARREASKRKCQYLLALLSVLFIVVVAGVCFTIANRASAIFLDQAEGESGEIDMLMVPTSSPGLNYTRLFDANTRTDGQYNTFRLSLAATAYSPRCTAAAAAAGFDVSVGGDNAWMYIGQQQSPAPSPYTLLRDARDGTSSRTHTHTGAVSDDAGVGRASVHGGSRADGARKCTARRSRPHRSPMHNDTLSDTHAHVHSPFLSPLAPLHPLAAADVSGECMDNCVDRICAAHAQMEATVVLVDSHRERAMALGRNWEWEKDEQIRKNTDSELPDQFFRVKISQSVARALNVRVGDSIPLSLSLASYFRDLAMLGSHYYSQRQNNSAANDFAATGYGYHDRFDDEYATLYEAVYGTSDLNNVPLGEFLNADNSKVLDSVLETRSTVNVLVSVSEVVSNWRGRLRKDDEDVIMVEYALPRDAQGRYRRYTAPEILLAYQQQQQQQQQHEVELVYLQRERGVQHGRAGRATGRVVPLPTTSTALASLQPAGLPSIPSPALSLLSLAHPVLLSRNVTHLATYTPLTPPAPDALSRPLLPLPPLALLLAGAAAMPLHECATELLVNLPPERTEVYITTNFDALLKHVVSTMSGILYRSGFTGVEVTMPVTDQMSALRMFSLFLGLIMSIILVILCILALMLIYSLMMISVETRTFEMAVHRMTGMGRMGVVNLLLVQALSYAVPAWVLGLILAQIVCAMVVNVLSSSVGVPLRTSLDTLGILIASLLGLGVPLLAAILPIRHALAVNVHEALDVEKHRSATTQVTITRTSDVQVPLAPILLGGGMAICGFLVYYLLPLSLISLNLALFFNIFFAILIGMLLGLILLAMNLQSLLERLLISIFLIPETRAVTSIVRKNLQSHADRNRKTTLMYALSMAFVIFITVAYTTELNAAVATTQRSQGADITLENKSRYLTYEEVSNIETILEAYSAERVGLPRTALLAQLHTADAGTGLAANDFSPRAAGCVEGWALVTPPLSYYSGAREMRTTNEGNYYEHTIDIRGVSPRFSDVGMSKFDIAYDEDNPSAMSRTEALYSVRGSQSALIDQGLLKWTGLSGAGRDSSFKLKALYDGELVTQRLLPLAVMDSMAGTAFTKTKKESAYLMLVSLPTFMALSGDGAYRAQRIEKGLTPSASYARQSITPERLVWDRMLIALTPSASAQCVAALTNTLTQYAAPRRMTVWRATEATKDNEDTLALLDLVFTILMWLTLALCLFSLTATTYCNVLGSAPEIAVLRALGMTKFAIARAAVEESFVLVVSSALMGVVIGFLMAWTMMLQRILFTQLPISFAFPYSTVYWVLLAAIISAGIACTTPLMQLMRKTISSTFKTFL